MGRRKKSKNPEGAHWRLPYFQARHPSWRSLSGAALKVYVELRCRYTVRGDGLTNNNGELRLSLDEAARLLHMSKSTARRAFCELEAKGYIVKTKQGQWYGRQATEWRITDLPHKGLPPTRDWQLVWKTILQGSVPPAHILGSDGRAPVPKDEIIDHDSTRRLKRSA